MHDPQVFGWEVQDLDLDCLPMSDEFDSDDDVIRLGGRSTSLPTARSKGDEHYDDRDY